MKKAKNVFAKSVVISVPIVRLVWSVLKENLIIFVLFLIFTSIIYLLFGGIIPIILLAIFVSVAVYNLGDNLLYHPDLPPHSRRIVSLPSIFGLPYETVHTWTPDGILIHLLVILQKEDSCLVPTVLYLHGNAGNVGHRLQNVAELYQNLRCNIVMLEYRGYGLSKGKPTEKGLYLDVRAALDYIASRKDLNHRKIIIFGRSLGGAVSLDVAIDCVYQDKLWCLILENTFTSIPEMAQILLGWRILNKLPIFIYKSKYLSKFKVSKLQVPTLFISGLADTLVPPRMMEELYDDCSSPIKRMNRFPDGSHNETWNCHGYYTAINSFLSELNSQVPGAPAS